MIHNIKDAVANTSTKIAGPPRGAIEEAADRLADLAKRLANTRNMLGANADRLMGCMPIPVGEGQPRAEPSNHVELLAHAVIVLDEEIQMLGEVASRFVKL